MIDDASVGGGQHHVLWLAERLDRGAFSTAVACAPAGYLVDQLRNRGIAHYPVRMTNRPSLSAFLRCREMIRDFRADIVHTHGGTAGILGRSAARTVGGVRTVHTYHGLHYLHDRRRLRRFIFGKAEAMVLKATDRIICVTERDVETGVRAGIVDRRKTTVIYNGIDQKPYARRRRRESDKGPVIGIVGRLHEQKGHAVLLKAFPAILRDFPEALVTVIGEGELRRELEGLAASLGILAHVRFAGSRTDIPDQLGRMDVFVLPSLWEGLPIVLMEAMAAGLPIVATAVDGVTEMIEHERTGLLVPPGDPAGLAAALLRMLRDRRLGRRTGDHARVVAAERFGIDRMVRETETVYKELMK
jgi:glycosyltransferase involved in cell wall biosynthesis